MVVDLLVRQSYRLYAAVLVVWGAWSLAWALLPVDMAATTVGYGWLAIAAFGVPVTLGLALGRSSLFSSSPSEIDRFATNAMSGAPLVAYATALVLWSGVMVAWSAGGLAVPATVVGYGWLAIAAFGVAITVGLVSTHRVEVMAAIGIETPAAEQI